MKYTKIGNKYYKVGEEINKTKLLAELEQQIADVDVTLQELGDKKSGLKAQLKEVKLIQG